MSLLTGLLLGGKYVHKTNGFFLGNINSVLGNVFNKNNVIWVILSMMALLILILLLPWLDCLLVDADIIGVLTPRLILV